MKKTSILRNILCTAALALMLIGCGGTRDYRNMIPDDSLMIISMNLKSLREKANIGDPTQNVFYKVMNYALESNLEFTDEDRTFIRSIMADPAQAGIDTGSDCFMFVEKPKMTAAAVMTNMGMVFKINDVKKFEALVDFIAQKSGLEKKAEKGFTILANDSNITSILAYNSEGAIIYIANDGREQALARVTELFNQKKDQSLLANKAILKTLETQNDMCMIISYANLPGEMMEQMKSVPMLDIIMKATVVMPVNFEKGQIVSAVKVHFADSADEKLYIENSNYVAKQNGNLVKFIPEGSIATLGMNMKGAKMYEYLTKIPMYGQIMSSVPQIKSVMEAIDGDMIISFNKMDASGKIPYATLVAELNDPAVLQNIMNMLAAMPVNQTAPYQYETSMPGFNVMFGLQGKMLYITTDQLAASAIKGGAISSIENRSGKLFAGSYSTFVIDFVPLHAMLQTMIANGTIPQTADIALPFVQIFDTWEINSTALTEGSMIARMTDKERNALDTIYHTIEAMVSPFIGAAIVDSLNSQNASGEETAE